MATIEAQLIGDWAEAYPGSAQLALILPLAFEGTGPLNDMRLRVEGIHKPLAWVGCWDANRNAVYLPALLLPPINAYCVFQGEGHHAPAYTVTLEGKTGWTWQMWGEFELRPGVARYVVRPDRANQRT